MLLWSTANRLNLSQASNVMKQINSKLNGESVRTKFPRIFQ